MTKIKKQTPFSTSVVNKIAKLAMIPVSPQEETALATAFTETIAVIQNLQTIDTTLVEPTAHATGLENVFREDKVNTSRMFTQEAALKNAPKTADGYFVVPRILHHDA